MGVVAREAADSSALAECLALFNACASAVSPHLGANDR
jgi:hypothetical protein